MGVELLLRKIKRGQQKRIKGVVVKRVDDKFEIDGDSLSVAHAIERLESLTAEIKTGIDYKNTAFFLKSPYSSAIVSGHRLFNRADHMALLKEAIEHKLYVYYGKVTKPNDKCICEPPMLLDWESVPDVAYNVPIQKVKPVTITSEVVRLDGLMCPFCSKPTSSGPGRTLHVKAAHPARLEEYRRLLDEPAVEEITTPAELSCPFCNKVVTSTAGRTLHVKSTHPERFDEYKSIIKG